MTNGWEHYQSDDDHHDNDDEDEKITWKIMRKGYEKEDYSVNCIRWYTFLIISFNIFISSSSSSSSFFSLALWHFVSYTISCVLFFSLHPHLYHLLMSFIRVSFFSFWLTQCPLSGQWMNEMNGKKMVCPVDSKRIFSSPLFMYINCP